MSELSAIPAKAVVFDRLGGIEELEIRTVDVPAPGPGEIRIRVNAIGLNRSEVQYREGVYPMEIKFPARVGYEAAGVVESIGEGVTGFAEGDRVSVLPIISLNACGAYGEMFTVPAELTVHSPPEISDEETAALWSSYITAYGMIMELVKIKSGDWVLATAASSSLGPPMFQMLSMLGARVIGTTRTRAKADAVREMGAEHVIVTDEEDLTARVAEITGGAGVRFAFDPIGGPIIESLLNVMAPYGAVILYGIMNTEPVNLPVMPVIAKNLSILGYAMYLQDRPERNDRAIAFIREGVKSGQLKPLIGKHFPFEQICDAVAFLEAMQHTGKIIVTPNSSAE